MLISALFFIVALEITFEFVTPQLFFILIPSGESCIETVSNPKSRKIFGTMFEKLPLDKSMTIFIFLEFCLSNENDFFIFSIYEFRELESANYRLNLFPIISVESVLSRPSIIS